MDIATMGALATKLTGFTVSFLEGVFCEGFCEVLDLGKDIVFEAIRKGQIDHEAAKALQSVDEGLLDDLKQFVAQELKSKKGKIPIKLKGKQLTEIFTSRLDTVDELVEQYAKEHALSEERRLALTYVLGEIKRVAAQAALQTMDGDDKRMVLVLSEVMKNVYSDSIEEISSLLSRTVYIRPTECYNCGNEDLHYDDRMQMASCSHCGRKTAYSKNEGLMNGVQRDLNDFRAKVEQYQQTILAGLAELSKKMDEHDIKNSEEHGEQTAILIGIQRDVQVLKNQQSQPQGNAGAQPTTVIAPASDAQSRQIRDIRVLLDLDRNIEEAEARLRPLLKATPSNGELRWLSLRIKSFDFTDLSKLTTKEINGANKCLRDDGQIPENNPEYQLYVKACEAEEARKAEEANIRQFKFETRTENGKTYSILTGIEKLNSTDVVIPKYDLQGNPVTVIGEEAFYKRDDLTSVTIPDGIIKIESNVLRSAFGYCTGLTSITIPNSVTTIGDFAFCDCTGLTSIFIPHNVTSIGNFAFCGCTNMTRITVDSRNPIYHSNGNCLIVTDTKTLHTGCKNSTIPDNIKSIGDGAFGFCKGLTSITIPKSVTRIETSAFCDCTDLTHISIPNSVTSIGDHAFDGCKSLTSITFPDSVRSIGGSAFCKCHSLTSVTIPYSVTSIGDKAFADCANLMRITVDSYNSVYHSNNNCLIISKTKTLHTGCKNSIIPDSVTSIGAYAFWSCEGLSSIIIPKSVKSIGEDAFSFCNNLTDIYYTGSQQEWAKIRIKEGFLGFLEFSNATIHYNWTGR